MPPGGSKGEEIDRKHTSLDLTSNTCRKRKNIGIINGLKKKTKVVAIWELGHKPITPALERQTQEEQVFEMFYMRPSLKHLSPPKKHKPPRTTKQGKCCLCGVRNIEFRII